MCLGKAHRMVSDLIGKYIWLIRILTAAGDRGLSLREITDKYYARYGQDYSRRTFNNHRSAVEMVFGVDIECDRGTNRYYIPYGDEVLDDDESISWMINTFTVSNLLSLGKERLSGRVSVEEIPSGQRFLTPVMQAMEDSRELEISYAKYTSQAPETLHVQPLAVKEHERRWYLVAYCHERSACRVYGLDRIVSLRETDTMFKMPKGFDIDSVFYDSYGIFFPKEGEKPQTIRFKASPEEAKYLRDLPLHRSQKEEGDGVFSIRVIPNEDLMMEFCKHAGKLEVIEPENLRSALKERLDKASKQYS